MDIKKKERSIKSRVHTITREFQASVNDGGISDLKWQIYFRNMMTYGRMLKKINSSWTPRSKNFPLEFRSIFQ